MNEIKSKIVKIQKNENALQNVIQMNDFYLNDLLEVVTRTESFSKTKIAIINERNVNTEILKM